jgi:hypothetical protein
MADGVDGLALSAIAGGALFLYSAVRGKTILGTIQAVIKGQPPSAAPAGGQITGINPADPSQGHQSVATVGGIPSTGSGQQAVQDAATARGWGPGTPDWQPLQNLIMQESGFSPLIRNPGGAFGIGQALGHGGSGTTGAVITYTVSGGGQQTGTVNEYGGFGLTDAQAQGANSGQAGPQAVWTMNYIAATYGNPRNAWAHEQSHNWY